MQVVPTWSGFFCETESKIIKEPHKLFYLPAINDSPTKFSTVLEVLNQVKGKAEKPGLTGSDLVLDQTIYTKPLEILNNPQKADPKNFINLQMGRFHARCIFMAVIGK